MESKKLSEELRDGIKTIDGLIAKFADRIEKDCVSPNFYAELKTRVEVYNDCRKFIEAMASKAELAEMDVGGKAEAETPKAQTFAGDQKAEG